MAGFGETFAARRQANARALEGFGTSPASHTAVLPGRLIRRGGERAVLYTIGYEKRAPDELLDSILAVGVTVLADIREKPISRLPAFRAAALRATCEAQGIAYESWSCLGSTAPQRAALKATGDFAAFARAFRRVATARMQADLQRLADRARTHCIALLCYERVHELCHRSIVADRLADLLDASILAL